MIVSFAGRFRSVSLLASTPLLAANLLEALLPFARNVALARLVAPEDFGLAISLSIVLGMLEVVTDFGLPILVVRKENRVPHDVMMGTLQSLAIMRAAVLGGILLAASPLVATLFHAPDQVGVYALLAPIVLLRGFENYGVKELMRRSSFGREAAVTGAAQVAAFATTVAAAWHRPDLTCMIWGLGAATVTTVALSHFLSPTRYRLRWNREARRDAARFGLPLLVNGAAASLTLSDRLLIGGVLGPMPLAFYNVAYGTAQLPRTVIARFLTSAFLPLFVRQREQGGDEAALFDSWAWCLSCLAFAYGLALSLVGDQLLALVFGPAYQPSRFFMGLAGLSVCVKLLALLPVPAAYAAGNTRLVAYGSILSALAVVPGALALLATRDLTLFLLGMTVGDIVALALLGRRARREHVFNQNAAWCAAAWPSLLLASLVILTWLAPQLTLAAWLGAGLAALAASGALYGLMLSRFDIRLRILFS
ncbi:oligosaccharide flippase family protein [uncultured Enterovirga sp.]|uniref:oligosaccharide flippase family protein n=1 Tax=uncultured Enterovirga sp. TaxID=2026352 RepID=UPI0035C9EEC4